MSDRFVLDVGNTTAAHGIFRDGEISDTGRSATNLLLSTHDINDLFDGQLTSDSIVVACVGVPRVADLLNELSTDIGFSLYFVSGTHTRGAHLDYETPETLGPDRIANTIAVAGGDFVPSIVVDCGTAITIDVVNSDKEFIGGMICPGLETSRNALVHYAPTLPDVDLVAPLDMLGTDTISCIQSGVVYGAAFMIDHTIERLSRHYGIHKIIITGGHASIIYPLLHSDVHCDEWLTLRGLGAADISVSS